MHVAVEPAPIERKPAIARLVEFYIYDFSEYMGWDVDDDGRFGYRYLDAYWSEPSRTPFLVMVDGRLAGFALVTILDGDDAGVTDMAEFFVMRRYRRQGVGRIAAAILFDRFPGPWRVRQIHANTAAQAFWRSVIAAYTNGDFTETATDRHVIQRFHGGSPAGTLVSGREGG